MIYKTSYFRKELRQAWSEDKVGTKRKASFALFLGLFSFAVFFVLQTLQRSVLSETVPQIMQTSYFSTVYIYIHLAFLLSAVYFIVYYDYLFFSEIRKNSWYMLVQMGYRPAVMIFLKFTALLSSVILIYSVGFCAILLLTVILKYNFITAYLPSLWFAGLVDLFLVTALSMTLSLFVRSVLNARYLIVFSVIGILLIKAVTGFYGVLSNRVTMQSFGYLFDLRKSAFMLLAGVLLLLCFLISTIRAGILARYYAAEESYSALLPEGVTIGLLDDKTGHGAETHSGLSRRGRIFNAAVTAVTVLLITLALLFNIMIILLSTATPGNEVTIRGLIPYIFQSDTMQPALMYNDLVYFRRVDSQYPVALGQIVLFQQDKVVYVERVVELSGANIRVDIDHYPPLSETGAMMREVKRPEIYGIYAGRNRWLGALILFSNTIVGRLLFLLVPAVLLFYKKQVWKLVSRRR